MRGHIPADYCTSPDDRAFADSYIWENNAVRANENVFLNDDLSISNWSSGARVEMGDDRRSKTDDTVVSDAHICGMYLIDVH